MPEGTIEGKGVGGHKELETRLIESAAHTLYTHSHYGSDDGYGVKARRGYKDRPEFDAIRERVTDRHWYPVVDELRIPDWPSYRNDGYNENQNGVQFFMKREEIQHTTSVRRRMGGLFKKVEHGTRSYPAKDFIRGCSKDEPVCSIYWCVRLLVPPDVDSDERSRRGHVESWYLIQAAKSDAEELWATLRKDPSFIFTLGRTVFPETFDRVTSGTKFKEAHFIESDEDAQKAGMERR